MTVACARRGIIYCARTLLSLAAAAAALRNGNERMVCRCARIKEESWFGANGSPRSANVRSYRERREREKVRSVSSNLILLDLLRVGIYVYEALILRRGFFYVMGRGRIVRRCGFGNGFYGLLTGRFFMLCAVTVVESIIGLVL